MPALPRPPAFGEIDARAAVELIEVRHQGKRCTREAAVTIVCALSVPYVDVWATGIVPSSAFDEAQRNVHSLIADGACTATHACQPLWIAICFRQTRLLGSSIRRHLRRWRQRFVRESIPASSMPQVIRAGRGQRRAPASHRPGSRPSVKQPRCWPCWIDRLDRLLFVTHHRAHNCDLHQKRPAEVQVTVQMF